MNCDKKERGGLNYRSCPGDKLLKFKQVGKDDGIIHLLLDKLFFFAILRMVLFESRKASK